jgi:hypothetical protein
MDSLKEKIALAINEVQEEFATAVGTAVINALSGGDITIGDIAELMGEGGDETSSPRTKKTSSSKASSRKGSSSGGKRHRRTEEDLQEGVTKLVRCVKAQGKDGASAETIREELGIERKELPRLIFDALKQRLLTKRGKKRGTMYFASGKAPAAGGGKKTSAKKTSAKKSSSSKKKTSSRRSNGAKSRKVSSASASVSSNGTTAAAAPSE